MALTQQFKDQIKSSPQPGAPAPASQAMNPDEFKNWLGATTQPKPGALEQFGQGMNAAGSAMEKTGIPGVSQVGTGMQAIANAPKDIAEQAKGGWEQSQEGMQDILNPNATGAAAGALKGFEGAAKVGAGMTAMGTALAAPIFKPVGGAIKTMGDLINMIPGATEYLQKNADRIENYLQPVANIGQTAGGILGAAGVPETVETVKNTAKAALTPKGPPPGGAGGAIAEPKSPAAQAQVKAHDAIDKEVRNTAEKYPDVGKALNHAEVTKGTEPIKVLSSYPGGKALPSMSKGGKMNSLPAINYVRTQMKALGKMKGNLVDTANKNISVDNFQKIAEERIDSQPISQKLKDSQKADVGKEMDSWRESYPNGIPTKEMDMLKTEHANESTSYKKTGFPSCFAPDTHSLIADTARDLVEKQGGEAPIEELNKWISAHHDAITVLEKMHGKTPHGGMFSRHVGGIAGEIMGTAAGMAVGHPFVGAVAGRIGSEAVNNVLSSHFISNPLKRSIIDSMKGEKPEVMQAAHQFLDDEMQGKHQTMLQLPEGKAPGTPENPHLQPPAQLGTTKASAGVPKYPQLPAGRGTPENPHIMPEGKSPAQPTQQSSQEVSKTTSGNSTAKPSSLQELDTALKNAKEYQPEFTDAVNKIAEMGGWKAEVGPVKTLDRAHEKIVNEGGYLRDANRSTIIVKNYSDLAKVQEAVKSQFPGIERTKDKFKYDGFKSAIINVMTPMGHEAEVAVTTPSMWKAKMELGGDQMYKEIRIKAPDWEKTQAKMNQLYKDAAEEDGLE